jgi:hypothetical protein
MPIVLDGSQGISTPMYGGAISSNAVTPVVGMKNRIINGACVIDQRNAGASVTPTANAYTLDRWSTQMSQASKFSVQQNAGSVTPPVGFSNYLGVTSTSAYSVGSGDYFNIFQAIEGFNTADLQWGTANAKTITLSFWVRSSLTGTFGGSILNSAQSRSYPFTYTINSANTWEFETITIAGDTTGTWLTTNGIGVRVVFGLGVASNLSGTAGSWSGSTFFSATGATSVVGTNGATFYITGVQLEVGSTATSFDYRSYGTELALCQRYYYLHASGNGVPVGMASQYGASSMYGTLQFPVTMRIAPTISSTSGTDIYIFYRAGAADNFNSLSLQSSSTTGYAFLNNSQISGTSGQAGWVEGANASAFVAFGAEL